jgi:very-short-patch-repair endonuclease
MGNFKHLVYSQLLSPVDRANLGQVVGGEFKRSFKSKMPEWKRDRAREMRHQPTKSEKLMWGHLRAKKLMGMKFRRQQPMLGFIADFYCPKIRLVVEVDGSSHEHDYDRYRDRKMLEGGFSVFRVANEELERDPDGVCKTLLQAVHYCSTGELKSF